MHFRIQLPLSPRPQIEVWNERAGHAVAAPEDAKPVAWAVFGYFPASGGWCMQANTAFTDEASADEYMRFNYENDGDWRVQPLYAAPIAQTTDARKLLALLRESLAVLERIGMAEDLVAIRQKCRAAIAAMQREGEKP
jgi:hypothetical protein